MSDEPKTKEEIIAAIEATHGPTEVVEAPPESKPVEVVVVEKPTRKRRNPAVKGGAFERKVGKQLSNWLTYGERANLFTRSVMSGGQWTVADRRGGEVNLPGDLAAAHPLAFDFLKHFCIEVKHNNALTISEYLLGNSGKHYLAKSIEKVIEQSERAGLYWMFIGKQDRRPTFVIMNEEAGRQLIHVDDFNHHWLFKGESMMLTLDDMLKCDSQSFMTRINNARGTPRMNRERRPLNVPAPTVMPRRELRI